MTTERAFPFSLHAFQRLGQRTQLTCHDLLVVLEQRHFVDMGTKPGLTRQHLLFYSKQDKNFFVAIRDSLDGTIVTILPAEYHQRLAWAIPLEAYEKAKALTGEPQVAEAVTRPEGGLYFRANFTDELGRSRQMRLGKLVSSVEDGSEWCVLRDPSLLRRVAHKAVARGLDPRCIDHISVALGRTHYPFGIIHVAKEWEGVLEDLDLPRDTPAAPEPGPPASDKFRVGCIYARPGASHKEQGLGKISAEPYGGEVARVLEDPEFQSWLEHRARAAGIELSKIDALVFKRGKKGERIKVDLRHRNA